MILGYRGTIGYDWSRLSLEAAEDKGRQSSALKKRCLLAEDRANKAERDAKDLRSDKYIVVLQLLVDSCS